MESSNGEVWISTRKQEEIYHRQRVVIFDRIIDLALNGTVSFEEAVDAYKEALYFNHIPIQESHK